MQKTATAFSYANRIEFWCENYPQEPPYLIIVYSTKEKIAKSRIVEVYNTLLDKFSNNSTFLKIEKNNSLLTFHFVDGANDLHFTIRNLEYNKEQLADFSQIVTGKFAMVVGLDNKNADRPILVPTKNEFEIITLAGVIK